MAWTVKIDDQQVTLDDFTFGVEWPAIAARTGRAWHDVYTAPATDAATAVVVYELACARLNLDDPAGRAAALTVPALIAAFDYQPDARPDGDLPKVSPGGSAGEPTSPG